MLYLGSTTQITLSAPGAAKLLVDLVSGSFGPVSVGQTVILGVDPKDISVLERSQ